jgi:hypothetical protein
LMDKEQSERWKSVRRHLLALLVSHVRSLVEDVMGED